ncbi:MAG: hypothetical protein MJZ22_06135 [Candidatus Saccharibacteria bacterium]|nr:hypothetical protein [Candidatus Saccharibacteria bacterium]
MPDASGECLWADISRVDIAAKDRLSRRQQVICAANDADGENGRCPAASQPCGNGHPPQPVPAGNVIGKLRKNPAKE